MLLSGLPPVVREADRFRASFTLRNASERRMQVQLTARVTPNAPGATIPALEPKQADLAPGEAREMAWDVSVPIDATKLAWQVEVAEGKDGTAPVSGGAAHDAMKVSQKVVQAVPERTYQATILQLTAPQSIFSDPVV